MLTKRTLLLTLSGLLIGYVAAAQSATTTVPAGPQPTDVLSWLAWFLAAVVLLFGMITAISLASAVAHSAQHEAPAEATSVAVVPPAPPVLTEQKVAA